MRQVWVHVLEKIMSPLIQSIQAETLHKDLPIVEGREGKQNYALLECFGRSLAGVGPYLNSNVPQHEKAFQEKLKNTMIKGLINGTSQNSKDAFNFSEGGQPIVDASFLAIGLLRCYDNVWLPLDESIKKNVIRCLKQTRTRKPYFNNWLLFSAMIEAFLFKVGEPDWDSMRIDYAIRQHEQWYVGDGVYGDGPQFHFDFYNSYVIQPYLLEIMRVFEGSPANAWKDFSEKILLRAKRYAIIQERQINLDGTFAVIGRSIAYRNGAFQHLSDIALHHLLPSEISPAQVRCALTSVLHRLFDGAQNFDRNGFLVPGLNGAQKDISEGYINCGSLYLTLCGFLHLGLEANDEFWVSPNEEWSAVKAWSGKSIMADHCL